VPRSVIGGALGGLLVGALVKLIGIDAFTLLVGRSPATSLARRKACCSVRAIGLA
jgi:hypothetical protein